MVMYMYKEYHNFSKWSMACNIGVANFVRTWCSTWHGVNPPWNNITRCLHKKNSSLYKHLGTHIGVLEMYGKLACIHKLVSLNKKNQPSLQNLRLETIVHVFIISTTHTNWDNKLLMSSDVLGLPLGEG